MHNLSYPLNVEGDPQQGHYIMFTINETEPSKVATGHEGGRHAYVNLTSDTEYTGFKGKHFISEHLNSGSGKDAEQFRQRAEGTGLYMFRPGTTRMARAITLYMPPSVKTSYKSVYKDDEISGRADIGGQVVEGLASSTGGVLNAAGGVLTDVLETTGILAMFAAKGIVDTAAPGFSTLAQISAGMILGSKMELMFTQVDRRTFSFQFNFIPKSEDEAIMVYEIVKTFKIHMLPKYFTSLGTMAVPAISDAREQRTKQRRVNLGLAAGRILKIPDTFDIFYFYHSNENPFLNRISTCYLTSMDVDYGGDKYVTYEPTELNGQVGPPPQRTSITLTFSEIEIITRERALQGF